MKALFLILLLIPSALAYNITMGLNQTDYYFNLGQNAVIPLKINSSYPYPVDAILSYTVTQKINQPGFHFESSNSKSATITVEPNSSIEALNFGASNTPSTLILSISLIYNNTESDLNNIKIHFVGNGTAQQTSPATSIIKKLQKSQQPTPQNVENNQMPEDTSALKKQIQEQLNKENRVRQEIKQRLMNSSVFRKLNRNMSARGYNLSKISVNPNGSFNLLYNKSIGSLNISGAVRNNSVIIHKQQKVNKQHKVKQTIKPKHTNLMPLLWLIAVVVIGALIFFFNQPKRPVKEKKVERTFDYKHEAERMLAVAESMFNAGRFKEAYGKANQAVRFYYGYKYNLKETTNDELLEFLKGRTDIKELKEMFDLCSLVEFAKYKPNKKDFFRILEIARKEIV